VIDAGCFCGVVGWRAQGLEWRDRNIIQSVTEKENIKFLLIQVMKNESDVEIGIATVSRGRNQMSGPDVWDWSPTMSRVVMQIAIVHSDLNGEYQFPDCTKSDQPHGLWLSQRALILHNVFDSERAGKTRCLCSGAST